MFLIAGNGLDIVVNLVNEMPEQFVDYCRVVGRKSPHIVEKAGDIISVLSTKVRHRQTSVFPRQIGVIINALCQRRSAAGRQSPVLLPPG